MTSRFSRARLVLAILLLCLVWAGTVQAKVKITYMSWMSGERGQMEQQIIDKFMAANPNIEVERLETPGYFKMYDKLVAMAAGGTPPDVAALGADFSDNLLSMATELTPYVQADKFDLSTIRPGFLAVAQREGRLYAMPWSTATAIFCYNKSMFEENGLTIPSATWNTDNLLSAAKRLTADLNGDSKTDRFGIDTKEAGFWQILNGGKIFDPVKGEIGITKPEFVSMVQYWGDLDTRYGVVGPESLAVQNKLGMWSSWDGIIPAMVTQGYHKNFTWGATYFPHGPNSETTTWVASHMHIIPKGSAHPREAWEFIKFYLSPEAQRILGRNAFYPVTKAGAQAMMREAIIPPGYNPMSLFEPIVTPINPYLEPYWVSGYSKAMGLVDEATVRVRKEGITAQAAMEQVLGAVKAAFGFK